MENTHTWTAARRLSAIFLVFTGGCETLVDPSAITRVGDAPDSGLQTPDSSYVLPDLGFPGPEPGPQACDPPLGIDPERITTPPVALRSFHATGGTGRYRFTLARDESGATLNPSSGAYLSGRTGATSDLIHLTDEGCLGTASSTVQVVLAMVVRPRAAEVPPQTEIQVEVSQGSGSFDFTLVQDRSGATISRSGRYRSGRSAGEDIIRVTDQNSNESVDLRITVANDAFVGATPSEVYVPVGSTYRPTITGGSGEYMIDSSNTDITLQDGGITSDRAGTALFTIEDLFTGQIGEITVTFVGPQVVTSTRGGDQTLRAVVLAPGDLDGDGFSEVVVGLPESDVGGHNAGAVYVYRGRNGGLEPQPALTLSGLSRLAGFGSALAVADLDGDGAPDLVVGAPRADVNSRDSGGVYLFKGIAQGLFERTHYRTLGGRATGDEFGNAVAACDFDGDSRPDLAVGASAAEDRGLRQVPTNQGAAFVFLNHSDIGFLSNPDQSLYGATPRMDGRFLGTAGLRMGARIAAGDIDNDGACDLAVASVTYSGSRGLVYVYPGRSSGVGGVTSEPHMALAGTMAQGASMTGAALAIADITGDDRHELLIGQPRSTRGGRAASGAMHLFLGRDLPTAPATQIASVETSDWSYEGPEASAETGSFVGAGDLDGDGISELLIGSPLASSSSITPTAGTLVAFRGRRGVLPERTPTFVQLGLRRGDRFGTAAAVVRDLDGDRDAELVVYSPLADDDGPDVGALYEVLGGTSALRRLATPMPPSGAEIGHSVELGPDVDNDGEADLLVGAPATDLRGVGLSAGAAYVFFGTPNGVSKVPGATLSGVETIHAGDRFGATVASAGDFDGDGVDDIAVLAPMAEARDPFPAGWVVENGCRASSRTNTGAVFIFRGRANSAPSSTPAFVYWPDQNEVRLDTVEGGFDYDGDNIDDLALGMPRYDRPGNRANAGRVVFLRGRPAAASGAPTVICNASFSHRGLNAGDRLGASLSALGDIDGDGCDDLAVGAPNEDLGLAEQGVIRVIFGWGTMSCGMSPTMAVFTSGQGDARAGESLAGGLDIDGDTIVDLAVGGPGATVTGDVVGAAWVVSGDHILGTPAVTVRDDTSPGITRPFSDPSETGDFRVNGKVSGGGFASSIALMPGASGAGLAGLVVGVPRSNLSGTPLSGAVEVYRFNRVASSAAPRGIISSPILALSGETKRTGGVMGHSISTGTVGGREILVGGSILGSGVSLDLGAVYVVTPEPR